MDNKKYWIGVVSKDHVENGVKLGIMQVCHWKLSPLKRIKKWDWIIYYSPKTNFWTDEKCQSFTAIWEISDDYIYQVEMFQWFEPFRRKVSYKNCINLEINPIINELDFIKDKKHWWYVFRYWLVEISFKDFEFISSNMLNK